MQSRAHVFVSGTVQGVFFRASTRDRASDLGLTGWVRNLRDGRVEAVFEGERSVVEKMLEWCWQGPSYSQVANVEAQWEEHLGEFRSFEVRY